MKSRLAIAADREEMVQLQKEIDAFGSLIKLPTNLHRYAVLVMTYPLLSVFIESMFSHMTYIKGKHRSVTGDDACVAVIQCKAFEPVDAHEDKPFTAVTADVARARDNNLKWIT